MPEPRKRTSHPKSRSGCITCKIRRKKCDETQPECQQCISTGRKCDGYAQVPDKRTREWRAQAALQTEARKPRERVLYKPIMPNSTVLFPPVKTSQIDHTWSERWFLERFRKVTVHQCSEFIEDTFWCGFLHQVLESRPAARYAAIALSYRHWQYEQAAAQHMVDYETDISLQHSLRAVSHLRKSLSENKPDRAHRETTLVTCLMMTMLAVYQQDAYAARCHFFSGYKLFTHWKAVDFDESPNARALELAFVQMHIHYTTSNNPRLFIDDQRLVIPEVTEISTNTFIRGDSMARAQGFAGIIPRMAMECLLYGGFCIGPARLPLGPGTPALFAMLRMWRSQLKAFSLQSGVLSEFDRDLLTLLELWSEIINIKLVVRDNSVPLEGTFDDHLEQFRSVIKMAGSLVEVNPTTLPAIFIKTSLVPALLYCGAKCRDSQIRDGVIRIIDGVKGKDPLISALLKALQKVTEYESKDVMLGDTIPEAARLGSVKLNIRPGQDQADLWYRRSRLDPHLHDDHGDWEHHIISI